MAIEHDVLHVRKTRPAIDDLIDLITPGSLHRAVFDVLAADERW